MLDAVTLTVAIVLGLAAQQVRMWSLLEFFRSFASL
jgi:hypothetical protein